MYNLFIKNVSSQDTWPDFSKLLGAYPELARFRGEWHSQDMPVTHCTLTEKSNLNDFVIPPGGRVGVCVATTYSFSVVMANTQTGCKLGDAVDKMVAKAEKGCIRSIMVEYKDPFFNTQRTILLTPDETNKYLDPSTSNGSI